MRDAKLKPYPLRDLVLSGHRKVPHASIGDQPMAGKELLGYIANMNWREDLPLESVAKQTEAIGDPALPGPLQAAMLSWVGEAFAYWLREYPLEPELGDTVRSLLPMTAAMAVTDPDFGVAGQHVMHRLLNALHDFAMGWQPDLGRMGDSLQQKIELAVRRIRDSRGSHDTLQAIADDLTRTAERDHSRAQRMAQRLIETERGRLRAAEARYVAASVINQQLLDFSAPGEVVELLKSHWYDSAQLAILRFGVNSPQWRAMCDVTASLVEAVQPGGLGSDDDPRPLRELAGLIPNEVKRWLLSLQQDPEAMAAAVQPIEACLLRILRQQPVRHINAEPLAVVDELRRSRSKPSPSIAALREGQWFRIRSGPDQVMRVQLALKVDEEQQLVFANQAGIKALQLDYHDFGRMLADKSARLLRYGDSFTRSLMRAAGIESDEALQARLQAEQEQLEQEQRAREAEEQRLREEAERKEREQQERLARIEAQRQAREEAERRAREEAARRAQEEAERRAQEEAERRARAEIVAAEVRYLNLRNQARKLDSDSIAEGAIDLASSMGAWMGFHDGDAPMMARLAVHDPEQDLYIFVNREGIKLREISAAELHQLIERGLVDMIEARGNFKDDLNQVRQQDVLAK